MQNTIRLNVVSRDSSLKRPKYQAEKILSISIYETNTNYYHCYEFQRCDVSLRCQKKATEDQPASHVKQITMILLIVSCDCKCVK